MDKKTRNSMIYLLHEFRQQDISDLTHENLKRNTISEILKSRSNDILPTTEPIPFWRVVKAVTDGDSEFLETISQPVIKEAVWAARTEAEARYKERQGQPPPGPSWNLYYEAVKYLFKQVHDRFAINTEGTRQVNIINNEFNAWMSNKMPQAPGIKE